MTQEQSRLFYNKYYSKEEVNSRINNIFEQYRLNPELMRPISIDSAFEKIGKKMGWGKGLVVVDHFGVRNKKNEHVAWVFVGPVDVSHPMSTAGFKGVFVHSAGDIELGKIANTHPAGG